MLSLSVFEIIIIYIFILKGISDRLTIQIQEKPFTTRQEASNLPSIHKTQMQTISEKPPAKVNSGSSKERN